MLIAQAVVACAPGTAADLDGADPAADLALWQCIAAMRTQDASFGPQLIKLATDRSLRWDIRRMAIWASGRLPSSAALEAIAPAILAERSPLLLDQTEQLQVHRCVIDLIEQGAVSFLSKGPVLFATLVSSILQERRMAEAWRGQAPSEGDVARWLYTTLSQDPSPQAIKRLLDHLRTPLLQAAVVRSFRIAQRPDQIEAALSHSTSIWLAIKCLCERRWARDAAPDLCQRLRHALTRAPCGKADILGRIVDEIESGRQQATLAVTASPTASSTIAPADAPPNLPISYSEAENALRGISSLATHPAMPLALETLDRAQVQRLIVLADPAQDRPRSIVHYKHEITLTADGYSAARTTSTTTGAASDADRLRPAIAAANRFELPIPWHKQRLNLPWVSSYAPSFIAGLGQQGEAHRLYAELEANPGILLPFLGSYAGLKATERLLGDRLAPTVHRAISLGDDAFFEILCNLTSHITSTLAVPILKGLLDRWVSRFDLQAWAIQGENIALWRGLARLRAHPRFRDIPGWRSALEKVLQAKIQWVHRQVILRALEGEPASYLTIERCLSREEDWVTFNSSEIDRLDEAAERLFNMPQP